MGLLITAADFINKYAVPSQVGSDLDSFIDDLEEDYLTDLLGSDMFADFKSKYIFDPTFPSNPGYLKILNKFKIDYGSRIYKSKGLVDMLCGFIFFDFMSQIKYKPTQQGMVTTGSDTSTPTTVANLYSYLNDATHTFQSIQEYVQNIHPEQFPPMIAPTDINYNGQEKSFGVSILN